MPEITWPIAIAIWLLLGLAIARLLFGANGGD